MANAKDIAGERFGRLTVIERAVRTGKDRHAAWKCRCECGKEVIVAGNDLRLGRIVSCGCFGNELHSERMKQLRRTHGKSMEGGKKTRLYRIWRDMKQRCGNPKSESYRWYGGRGISVCDEWMHDFEKFYEWAVSNGYRDDLTIDRKDNDIGYSPSNCRWATAKEQAENRRGKT